MTTQISSLAEYKKVYTDSVKNPEKFWAAGQDIYLAKEMEEDVGVGIQNPRRKMVCGR